MLTVVLQPFCRTVLLSCALFIFVASCAFGSTFDTLLQRVPESANAIIVLDVEALFASPLAKQENWQNTYADSYAATPIMVPPRAQRYLVAAELNLESMKPVWEVAATHLSADPPMAEVAKRVNGATDTLGGLDAVWTNRRACVVRFAPHEFGMIIPATRQQATRWATAASQPHSSTLSPYLRQAVGYAAGAGPEVIMALELANNIRPQEIQAAVKRSVILKEANHERVSKILSSLQGITLGVRVTDQIHGKLLVDFAEDATELTSVAKPLILHVLAQSGAGLDEMQEWTSSVSGKRISFSGKLSTDGMRRLFSIVALDSSLTHTTTASAAAASPASSAEIATASKKYFDSVMKYLSDLQKARNTRTFDQVTLWATTFSRKIARLPSRNVDPDMVAYGQYVAQGLQAAVGAVQGIEAQALERASQVIPATSIQVGALPTYDTANYGGYYMREYAPFAMARVDIASAIQERQQIANEEYQKGITAAEGIIDQLRAATGQIQSTMSQRYGITF